LEVVEFFLVIVGFAHGRDIGGFGGGYQWPAMPSLTGAFLADVRALRGADDGGVG
jgi:hypothetical protein